MIAERGGRGIGANKTTIKRALDSSNIFSLFAFWSGRGYFFRLFQTNSGPYLAVLWIRMFFDRIHYLCGSVSESGSGSFHHLAKILRKTLISTVLWLLHTIFFFEEWCKCTFKKENNKKTETKKLWRQLSHRIRIRIHKSVVQIRGSGSVPKCHGSTTL